VQELAPERPVVDLQGHRLRQVALGHGADNAGRLARRVNQVADQVVDRIDGVGPGAAHVAQRGALRDLALLADDAAEAVQFPRHALVQLDHVVKGVGNLAGDAGPSHRQASGEIAFAQFAEGV
jgi:hypothetical protein